MKKSLNINATRDGKKVSKSLGYVNPDAANSIVGGFAQMVNALSNDTFVNAEVVKKMDTSEEEQQGGSSGGTVTLHINDKNYSGGDGEDPFALDVVNIEGGVRLIFRTSATGKLESYIDVTYSVE